MMMMTILSIHWTCNDVLVSVLCTLPALSYLILKINHSWVQSFSHVWLFETPWTAAHQASLSVINSGSLLKLMFIESVMQSHPLSSPSPPTFNLSQHQGLFQWVRWPKYWSWSFSFSISPSNEYSGLTSFRIDWLDLLAVQGTLKSLLQHHSSKASILRCSAFFIVQLSHPHVTTVKTIALTRWNFVGKIMSLLFNILSMLTITFLPRSKRLLISWLQSPSAVILEPPKIKSLTVSIVSPSICHEVMGPDVWRTTRPSRTNTQKRCHFHYRRQECKSRKSRNTWSNRQIWLWSAKWRRAKSNRVLPC